jgi:hypothetical protein
MSGLDSRRKIFRSRQQGRTDKKYLHLIGNIYAQLQSEMGLVLKGLFVLSTNNSTNEKNQNIGKKIGPWTPFQISGLG